MEAPLWNTPHSRSRGGCQPCRGRKRKCDEAHPVCQACQKRGLSCSYSLNVRWNPAGKTTNINPKSKSKHERWKRTESPLSTGDESVQSYFSEYDWQVLEQFLKSGIFTLYNTKTNDWIQPLIEKLSLGSYSLASVCIALQLLLDTQLSEAFYLSYSQALDRFQDDLSQCNGKMAAGTMMAGTLLCTLCILQGLPWTSHLLCMTNLYNLNGNLTHLGPGLGPSINHCLEAIGVMDLPTLVIGRNTPNLHLWKRFRQSQSKWPTGKLGGIDAMSGLPRSLLDLFAQIADAGIEKAFWLWPGELGELLQVQLWNAWRFAGMIRARRLSHHQVGTNPPSHSLEPDHDNTPVALPSTEQLICWLLSSMDAIRLGIALPEHKHLLVGNAIMYPYLAAVFERRIINAHAEWKSSLSRMRAVLLASNRTQNNLLFMKIMDDAIEKGGNDDDGDDGDDQAFDPNVICRRMGVEIALF